MQSSSLPSSGEASAPFSGIRVIETGALPAAAYCARLLADFGAEVIKLEPPEGDPGRRGVPALDIGGGEQERAYFAYLNFNKQSAIIKDSATLRELVAGADVLIDGRSAAERRAAGVDHKTLRREHPHLIIADLSWFGASGPYKDFHGSDAVCRALAGLVKLVGPVEGPPLALADYQACIFGGLSAFIPVCAALMSRLDGAPGRRFEVSVHEAAVALSDLDVSRLQPGYVERRAGINLFTAGGTLGIFRCKQGWIGMTFNSPAQWKAFCDLLGMPHLGEDRNYSVSLERARRAAELESMLGPRFLKRTADEWLEEALRLKLPFAVVPDMAELLESEVFRRRGAIVEIRSGEARVRAPGSPLHLGVTPPISGGIVPRPGEHTAQVLAAGVRTPFAPVSSGAPAGRPLQGLRVIDLSMGWAGPVATRMMADLGADIIKVESCQYADWWRGHEKHAAVYEQMLYEKTSRFNLMNRGKRGITLDLTTPDGVRVLKQLVAGADAVIDNNSAGVLPKLGLDYPRLVEVNPSLVMLSMNAYGSGGSGGLRELRAYGSTLEHGSGLPSISGREGDPPVQNHVAFGDPIGGLNSCSALLVALMHRRRTGVGQFIDLSQVECMLPLTAAWMIEQSASGRLAPRMGNRHPMHTPHGVFRCAGEDEWVMVTLTDDAMWQPLCAVIGRDDLARDAALAGAAGRRAREDHIEQAIEAWTRTQSPQAAMLRLQQAGVAAGAVHAPGDLLDDAHLIARGYWQPVDRPYMGVHQQPSAPFREDGAAYAVRMPAPTLGQHNDEVFKGLLGMTQQELERLAELQVIGQRAIPPSRKKAAVSA